MKRRQNALPLGLPQRHEAHRGRDQRARESLQIEPRYKTVGQIKAARGQPSATG